MKIRPDGEPSLQVLDCGIIYSSKSESEHDKLAEICFCFMKHDGRGAANLMMDLAYESDKHAREISENARAGFIAGVENLVRKSEQETFFKHIAEYLNIICDLARDHHVRLDPGYFKIAMALKVAEGMSLTFDNTLDLVSKCAPIIVKAKAMRKLGIKHFPVDED